MAKKRANNEGSIYKHKDKWRAAITLPSGKRTSKVFPTWDDASAWRNSMLTDINSGTLVVPSGVTLGEWGVIYIETYTKPPLTAQKTYERYLQLLDHLAPISFVPIQELTETQIQTVINNAQAKKRKKDDKGKYTTFYEPASQGTKLKIYRIAFQMLKKAASERLIKFNPLAEAKPPRVSKPKIEVFDKEEVKKIITPNKKTPSNMLLVVKIAVATGMRLSEILGLHWKHFNHKRNTLAVEQTMQQDISGRNMLSNTTKTASSRRTITISQTLAKELSELQDTNTCKDEFIILTSKQTPVKHSNFERWWRSWLREKEVAYKNFHVIRHTHATELLRAGVPIMDVSKRLGHSVVSATLNTYSHALECDHELSTTSESIFGI